MVNIQEYIKLSVTAKSIIGIYTDGESFKEDYAKVKHSEKEAVISHYMINNLPFAFNDKPLVFEQILYYLSDNLEIPVNDIKLIGSSKTGFSLGLDNYGAKYSPDRDLDFTIINRKVFDTLKDEFELFVEFYDVKMIKPQEGTKEKFYWDENVKRVPNNIKRGFIDTNKIPNRTTFSVTSRINDSLYQIKSQLNTRYNMKPKSVSVRVYKDWTSFISQLKLNTEYVLNKIK